MYVLQCRKSSQGEWKSYSSLGPIDPQVQNRDGKLVAVLGYLDKINELLEKAVNIMMLCPSILEVITLVFFSKRGCLYEYSWESSAVAADGNFAKLKDALDEYHRLI